MPRILAILLTIVLVVGVIGGAGVWIYKAFLQDDTSEQAEEDTQQGALPQAGQGDREITDSAADADGDGLLPSDEALWGTDPNEADTDGDGTNDGDEVEANRNPTVPGPDDALPPGFSPDEDRQPARRQQAQLQEAPEAEVPVDEFFSSELNLNISDENLTEEYRSQYPEGQRTPDTLNEFAKNQRIVTQLPEPVDRAIQPEPQDTPLVMSEYLEVAGNLGVFSNRQLLAEAINDLFENNDPSTIRGMALTVRLHQENLLEQRVPPSAVTLQKLLLGYTELLATTYEQMAVYNDDPVKAVVAFRQLEEIDDTFYPVIEREVDRLRAQQQTSP